MYNWAKGKPCLLATSKRSDERTAKLLVSAGLEIERTPLADAVSQIEASHFSLVCVLVEQVEECRALVACARSQHPEIPVVVVASNATVDEAVLALQLGVADYVPKEQLSDKLIARIAQILASRPSGPDVQTRLGERPQEIPGLIGRSPEIMKVLTTVAKVSRYKANVLLLGESGTGKELIARGLHSNGPRRGHLFVPINCATLGKDLLESELFGHERGAFTGANERKNGLFELADGGTLFLDEIAEMDPSTQAKLLRVLERNEFRRVGGTSKIKVDLSLIAATNRDLLGAVERGSFREDLYYRLKVVTISVPPLRERREDIPMLVEAFIADFNRRNGGKIRGIQPHVMSDLMSYDWPGNVRELKNAIESAAVLASGDTIGAGAFADLFDRRKRPTKSSSGPPQITTIAMDDNVGPMRVPVGTSLADAERVLILATLAKHKTKAKAARVLGIGLRTLFAKLSAYGARDRAENARSNRKLGRQSKKRQ